MPEAIQVQQEKEKAQTALKGYADTMVTLTGPSATNAASVAASPTPATSEAKPATSKDLYLVVDLSRGTKAAKGYPVTYLADLPKGGWSDEYKTDKLVLTKIEPGTFVMGSPEDEVGHNGEEIQHEVTLTQAFYIGVFEVTQKQWERVMGNWPSFFNNAKFRDSRPVEKVSYNDIRGPSAGAGWPATNSVDAASFLGRLRLRTGKTFDLPTEAQWEYACRAGTTAALNSGKNLTATDNCPNLSEVARYKGNSGDAVQNGDTSEGTAKVGSYPPNNWGLYDMHGNVWEWCLDWLGNKFESESDPKGVLTGSLRVGHSGSWDYYANRCRSASRGRGIPANVNANLGFRAAMSLDQQ